MSANPLMIYNTLSREKEVFAPLNPPFTGMYVCGPTVYGDAHLGHARPAITFDLVFRFLKHLGYKVRYVRNITDVGHLENDEDQGEDKIGKKARLEQLEPMEVVQWFTDRYHQDMDRLNVLRPSIEPRASGHITEQIEMIRAIILSGYAYEVNGSVYFDVQAYHKKHHYGILSGRQIEDLMANTRDLQAQQEKRNPLDFALWKKAGPGHIMRWPSPWSEGFPGWHLECSAMSTKYLGETFDIHGGGLDLLFPHHECEIAQSRAASKKQAVRYWMHNNMITINGQKMGKSLGNFITLREFFTGDHEQLSQAYDPMTIRFFMLQAHYRSTLDFSNEALQAAQKGLARLSQAHRMIRHLPVSQNPGVDVSSISARCEAALLDDFNSPVAIAHLFDATKTIHAVNEGRETLDAKGIETLQSTFDTYLGDIMGIGPSADGENAGQALVDGLMKIILDLRGKARQNKDWEASDQIRDTLEKLNIRIKDGKDGADWSYN